MQACQWLRVTTTSGLLGVLWTLGISHKRGRDYTHSPDSEYEAKVAHIENTIKNHDPDKQVILFLDELTIYQHPSVGYDYSSCQDQPKAVRGLKPNKCIRVAGAVNGATGQVHAIIRNEISVSTIVLFYQELVKAHPGKQLIVIQDNWPNHTHPDVVAALEKQNSPFAFHTPKSWSGVKPRKKFTNLNLPIQMVFLPTYASWLNPIEKVWKKLKQEKIHLHTCTDAITDLKEKIAKWFDNLGNNKEELLKYMGLRKENSFYVKAFGD